MGDSRWRGDAVAVKVGDTCYSIDPGMWECEDDGQTYSNPGQQNWLVISVCENGDPIVCGTVFSNGCHQVIKRFPLNRLFTSYDAVQNRMNQVRIEENDRYLANKARTSKVIS